MAQRNHSPKKDLSAVSVVDWARLAAFLDGEGSISIVYAVHKTPRLASKRTQYEYVRLTIANTDPRLIDWLVATFGGIVRSRVYKRNDKWKPAFWWTSSCQRAAEILRGCLPYFILKRDRAELALALQATMVRSGRKGTPIEVIERRGVIKQQLHALNAKGPQALTKVS